MGRKSRGKYCIRVTYSKEAHSELVDTLQPNVDIRKELAGSGIDMAEKARR